jgi:hypothetical protein
MAAKKGSSRTVIDASKAQIVPDLGPPPAQLRGSKYPWNALVGNPAQSFLITFDSEEAAHASRTTIQSSGRNFAQARDLNLRAVSRVLQHRGKWVVASWLIVRQAGESDEE